MLASNRVGVSGHTICSTDHCIVYLLLCHLVDFFISFPGEHSSCACLVFVALTVIIFSVSPHMSEVFTGESVCFLIVLIASLDHRCCIDSLDVIVRFLEILKSFLLLGRRVVFHVESRVVASEGNFNLLGNVLSGLTYEH